MYEFGVGLMIVGSFFGAFSAFIKNNREKKVVIGIVVAVFGTIIASN